MAVKSQRCWVSWPEIHAKSLFKHDLLPVLLRFCDQQTYLDFDYDRFFIISDKPETPDFQSFGQTVLI